MSPFAVIFRPFPERSSFDFISSTLVKIFDLFEIQLRPIPGYIFL